MKNCVKLVATLMFCAIVGTQDICIPAVRVNNDPQLQINQGPPGKSGPIGRPGAKGDQGPDGQPGQCQCEENVEIRNQLSALNQTVATLLETVTGLNDALAMLRQPPSTTTTTNATPTKPAFCNVGMKDGRVADDQITASSIHSPQFGPNHARLDNPRNDENNGGAWHSFYPYIGRWIEVDLRTPTRVTGITTQGRQGGNCCWITAYKISFGNTANQLQTIQNQSGGDFIFQGNTDRNSHVTNRFPQPVTARYFRLTIHQGGPYLRMEYLTC